MPIIQMYVAYVMTALRILDIFCLFVYKLQDVRSDEMRTLKRNLCNSGLIFVWNIYILNNIEANLYLMLGGNCTQVVPMLPGNLADVVHIYHL